MSDVNTWQSRRTYLKGVGAAGVIGLAGCTGDGGGSNGDATDTDADSGGDTTTATTGDSGSIDSTLRVGALYSMSNGWGKYGNGQVRSHELWADEKESDYDVEFFVEDTAISATQGVEKAQKLIGQNDIDVLVGPNAFGVRQAVSQVTEQEQIPHLYFNPSGGGEVPDYCNNYLFNLGASARMAAGNEVTDYLMSEYGKDWYTLGSDLSLSRNLSSLHADKLAENGGSMLGEKYVQFGVTDFTSILEDIEAEDPDVVFSPLTVNSAIAFMRQAQERGIRDSIQSIQFFMSHGSFEDTDPDTVKGALQTTEYYQNIETDMNQQFVSAYQDKYGPEVGPHQYDGKVYHAYQLLDQAIQTGGSTAAADITNELTDLAPTSTIYGESSIGHDNQAKIKYRIGRVNSDNEFETEKAFGPIVSDPVCE